MQDYLTFQLYGVLASWGEQAVGGERPSNDHPSRSAMLGLLAAALGIKRKEEDKHLELAKQCRFGFKLYSPGWVIRDFHTSQVPSTMSKIHHLHTRRDELNSPKLNTILSSREYRQDTFTVVALWFEEDGEFTLEQIKAALKSPSFHLYLGRKSCPLSLPLSPVIQQAETMKQALDSYQIDKQLTAMNDPKQPPRYYWEQTDDHGCETIDFHTSRYDQPTSRKRWQFASRNEYVNLGGE